MNKSIHEMEDRLPSGGHLSDSELSQIASAGRLVSMLGEVLGLDLSTGMAREEADEKTVLELVEKRNDARAGKDFKKADEIRKMLLKEHGIILEDTKDQTVWRRQI